MGHINYNILMETDRKGPYGEVLLDGKPLKDWKVSPLPLDEATVSDVPSAENDGMPGGVYRAKFTLDEVADTCIDMSQYTKDTLNINGINLGRYWSIAR